MSARQRVGIILVIAVFILASISIADKGGAEVLINPSSEEVNVEVIAELPGMWLFCKDPNKIGEEKKWFVPGKEDTSWKPLTTRTFWPEYIGDGWYAVDVVIPSGADEKVWLVFGAIDENYTLWINGEYIGDNVGTPGEMVWDKVVAEEITGKYKPGKNNHIVVRVNNTAAAGGIWKPVYVVKGPIGKFPESENPRISSGAGWLEPSDELITPHITWAKPSAEGPCKVLFITYRLGMREVVEICQRFDIKREVFAIETPKLFYRGGETGQSGGGEAGRYDSLYDAFPGITPKDQKNRLREKLNLDYDCIVIGNIQWNVLPDWARENIMQKVAAGTGMVGYIKGNLDSTLRSATAQKFEINCEQILGAYPFKGLPAFAKYGSTDEFGKQIIDVARYGEGRIVLLSGYECPTYQMLAPGITTPFTEYNMVYYDYYLAMVGHLIQWAAKQHSDVRICQPEAPIINISSSSLSQIPFLLDADRQQSVDLEFALRHAESGEIFVEEKQSAVLTASQNKISFKVDSVPVGRYFADLWVKNKDKILTFGSLLVDVTSETCISEIILTGKDFKSSDMIKNYSQKEPITGYVVVKGGHEGLAVEVNQRDNYGRLIARKRYPVTSGTVDFVLQPLAARSVLQWIDVRLLEGETLLDTRRESFTYNDLYLPEPGKDITYVMWEGLLGNTYLNEYVYRVIRDAGFDLVWTQFNGDESLSNAGAVLRANLYEFSSLHYPSPVRPILWGDPKPVKEGSACYVRKPCLTDPEIMGIVADTYRNAAKTAGKYSTTHYHIGSETQLTSHNPDREVCFSPTCIQHFRNYLKQEYGTIDALNAEYNSHYADWNNISPVDFMTAIRTGQIPLWFDFRRNMDTVWADFFVRAKETISEVVVNAKVGTEGSDDPAHQPNKIPGLGGDDWWKLDNAQSLNIPYFCPPQLDVLRDFAAPGTVTGVNYGGYTGVFRGERKGDWHRWLVWYALLRDRVNSLHVWQGSGFGVEIPGTTIAPDFTWYDFMKESIRAVNEIQDGIGKLILAMDRPDDHIAVLYSQGSMLMANLSRDFPQRWDSLAAVSLIFPESNFQYRYITPEQLKRGILKEGGYKLLYLPYCQALSPEEIKSIRTFVYAGGTVVADLRPGVTDEHGKRYAGGALDDVFGIKQDTDTMNVSSKIGSVLLKESIGDLKNMLPQATADTTLKLNGGEALGSVDGIPAIIINNLGKGKAILLNFAICDYVLDKLMAHGGAAIRLTDNDTAAKTASLIQGLFAKCGLIPEVKLTPHVPGCHLYRFTSGDAQVIGLLWDIPPYLPGIGNLPMKDLDEISATWSRDIALNLDKSMHVYDVLERKYLGRMQEISRTVKPGVVHILAVLPYKVQSVSLKPAKESFKQGEMMSFSAEVLTDGLPAGLHVLRIELIDPEGKQMKMYTLKAKAEAGRFVGGIQLSLNEKIGKWKMTVRDIATGAGTDAYFDVVSGY